MTWSGASLRASSPCCSFSLDGASFLPRELAFHPDLRKVVAVAVAMEDQFAVSSRPVHLYRVRYHKRGGGAVRALNQQHERTLC